MDTYSFKNVMSSIPEDHSNQTSIKDFTLEIINNKKDHLSIMDLGCGNGNFFDFFKQHFENFDYVGVDLEYSQEAKTRIRSDFHFVPYNGVDLPFDDNYFNIIFMNQVLEHVRKPHLLFPEIKRCMNDDAILIGSVSQLEPYHSCSILNYTFYGLCSYIDLFGLSIFKLRPGIDGITLINRSIYKHILNITTEYGNIFFENESPINYQLQKMLYTQNNHKYINLAKLRCSGQFCFAAKKTKRF